MRTKFDSPAKRAAKRREQQRQKRHSKKEAGDAPSRPPTSKEKNTTEHYSANDKSDDVHVPYQSSTYLNKTSNNPTTENRMQGRGTAHWHAAVHVKDAPRLDVQSDEEVASFIDKHICCSLPNGTVDPELHELVKSRQTHHHTSKYLLDEAGVTFDQYQFALNNKCKKVSVITKRLPDETNVNNYNYNYNYNYKSFFVPLEVTWTFSLSQMYGHVSLICVHTCVSLSEPCLKASKESNSKPIREQLFSIGQIFLKSREVSTHEAIIRLLPLCLRKSDLDVSYILTDLKENRTRLMKPISVISSLHGDDEDLFVASTHDKYASRPYILEDICLAEFSTTYTNGQRRNEEEEETEQPEIDMNLANATITLQNNLGKLRKRKRPSILRYHFVSREKDSECYYHIFLLMYFPWSEEESLRHRDGTYESRFKEVQDTICDTIQKYEPFSAEVEDVVQNFDPNEADEDIWNFYGERERDILENSDMPDPNYAALDPDNIDQQPEDRSHEPYETERNISMLPDIDFFSLISTLNRKQKMLFQFIYEWAVHIKHGSTSRPFHIFLSGEGATGKSHLVHAVSHCVTRTLREAGSDPDKPTVLITAPTGKAATNINGTTLHSAFPLPIRDNFAKEYKKPSSEHLAKLHNRYANLKLLIIDEISMVGGSTLENLSLALQNRGCPLVDCPFLWLEIFYSLTQSEIEQYSNHQPMIIKLYMALCGKDITVSMS
ncbi:uncharacterized protein LOC124112461 [Haliotis rufescens]|uniref:uncharacterized protein LOC124112461 n=1 Tax=Haliotis rufescens TaxID=6454 RepID=UPI00201FAB0C|nr:uncharacterized protein LOC124112461 [Haliotis rufescens]